MSEIVFIKHMCAVMDLGRSSLVSVMVTTNEFNELKVIEAMTLIRYGDITSEEGEFDKTDGPLKTWEA